MNNDVSDIINMPKFNIRLSTSFVFNGTTFLFSASIKHIITVKDTYVLYLVLSFPCQSFNNRAP